MCLCETRVCALSERARRARLYAGFKNKLRIYETAQPSQEALSVVTYHRTQAPDGVQGCLFAGAR